MFQRVKRENQSFSTTAGQRSFKQMLLKHEGIMNGVKKKQWSSVAQRSELYQTLDKRLGDGLIHFWFGFYL